MRNGGAAHKNQKRRRAQLEAMPQSLSIASFPFFPNSAHLTANDKDFSLALEMTIRENPISPSLLVS